MWRLNVYVVEVAKPLAAGGVEVDIFTRAVSASSRRWPSWPRACWSAT